MVPFFHTLFTPFSHDFHTHSPSSETERYIFSLLLLFHCFQDYLPVSVIDGRSSGNFLFSFILFLTFTNKLYVTTSSEKRVSVDIIFVAEGHVLREIVLILYS